MAVLAAACGGTCVINGRDETRLKQTISELGGDRHNFIVGALTAENASDLVKTAIDLVGPLSGLVHCAGVEKIKPFRVTSIEDLREIMSINFEVFWGLSQAFVRKGHHDEAGASVVSIGSSAALYGAKGVAAYAASKGALISLTRSLAAEYSEKGVRFNCISPGMVDTPMLDYVKKFYIDKEHFAKEMLSRQPLGLGRPEDVAGAVVWLLSPAAKWIIGSNFEVDGGYSIR